MDTDLVVGIDVSLTGTGIARSDGRVATVGQTDVLKLPLRRQVEMIDILAKSVAYEAGDDLGYPAPELVRPRLVVIEAMQVRKEFGGIVERSWLWLGIVRWYLDFKVPIAVVNSSQRMRYATGKGMVSKGAVIDAVARRWPMFNTSGNDNLCDAAVLCAMGCDKLGRPLATVPATHRTALATWVEAV